MLSKRRLTEIVAPAISGAPRSNLDLKNQAPALADRGQISSIRFRPFGLRIGHWLNVAMMAAIVVRNNIRMLVPPSVHHTL